MINETDMKHLGRCIELATMATETGRACRRNQAVPFTTQIQW